MQTFIDLVGLSTIEPRRVADALSLEGEYLTSTSERDNLLARLVNGGGVRVITGPLSAVYWSAASVEVIIEVQPDGYLYKPRSDLDMVWSLQVHGIKKTDAVKLAAKPPTQRHKFHETYRAAEALLKKLKSLHGISEPMLEVEYVPTIIWPSDADALFSSIVEFTALDWEWDPDTGAPQGLAISTAKDNYYIPLVGRGFEATDEQSRLVVDSFGRYLMAGKPCVLHGGRADLATIYPSDPIELVGKPIHDTLIMAYLADPTADDLGLKVLARSKLGRHPIDYPGSLRDIPVEVGARYATADTRNTYDLFVLLSQELVSKSQWQVYLDFEQPLMPMIASMEKTGAPVDMDKLFALYREHIIIEAGLRQAILDNYGFDVKTAEGGRAFVKSFTGYDPGSLDQRVISKHRDGRIDLLLTYRQTRTRRRYLKAHLKRWALSDQPADFRLFPRFNQAGKDNPDGSVGRAARTGRLTSTDPNFQQTPPQIRDIFVGEVVDAYLRRGRYFSFDFSGLELHIAAGLSGDPIMLGTLTEACSDLALSLACSHHPKHRDLHLRFQLQVLELTGKHIDRRPAKTGNFEQLYGGGWEQLIRILAKQRVFIDEDTARAVVNGHKLAFPRFHQWAAEQKEVARTLGYASTYFGRRRYLPELRSLDTETVSHGDRAAVNHPIQGTAADVVKKAMLDLVPVFAYYKAHCSAQVHDEIAGWLTTVLPEADELAFVAEVKRVMTSIELPGIRLAVEGGLAATWGEAH